MHVYLEKNKKKDAPRVEFHIPKYLEYWSYTKTPTHLVYMRSGTGYVLAIAAALKGGEVVMLNRKSTRSSEALANIKTKCPTAKVHAVACDLQDFESVRTAAAEVARKFPGGIDVLVRAEMSCCFILGVA